MIKLQPTNVHYHQHKDLDHITHQAKLSSVGDGLIDDAVHLPPAEELPQPGLNNIPIQPGGNSLKIFTIKHKKINKNIKANNYFEAAKKYNLSILKKSNKNNQLTIYITYKNKTKKYKIINSRIKNPNAKFKYSITEL